MNIAITADSTTDLSPELIKRFDIKIIPFGIYLSDVLYKDGEGLNSQMIFDEVKKTNKLPKTNAINIAEYVEFFTDIRRHYDAIIHFDISSDISSAYSNAKMASKSVDNVYVIDTRTLSTGMGCLEIYARRLCDENKTPSEIVRLVTDRIPSVQASFVVERLDYLYKGGRCNSLQLLGANLLKLRPCIELKDGKMVNTRKYRGHMEKVVEDYVVDTLKEYNNPDTSFCFITYSSATNEMLESARKALKENAHFSEVFETTAGCTVTSHCGEHTLGILYFNDGKH